jgi:MFS superfamily sulfate permease-like transporter
MTNIWIDSSQAWMWTIVGVLAGITLASLLLLRRRWRLTGARLQANQPRKRDLPIPPGVLVYRINEPLALEAARRGVNALHSIGIYKTAVVFDLEGVRAVDAPLVYLGLVLSGLQHDHSYIVLAGPRDQVAAILGGAGLVADNRWVFASPSRRDGIALAVTLVSRGAEAVTRKR